MKKLFLLAFLSLLAKLSFCQEYNISIGGYSGSATYIAKKYTVTGSFGTLQSTSNIFTTTSKPTSFSIKFVNSSFSSDTCEISGTVPASVNECFSASGGGPTASCGGGGNTASVVLSASPIIDFEEGTTTGSSDDKLCQDESISLKTTSGFSSYKFQYKIENGDWTDFTPGGTGNNRTVSLSNLSGSLDTKLLKNINFRYAVGNCSFSSPSTTTGPYIFAPLQAKVTGVDKDNVKCFGGNIDEIVLTSNRLPLSGISEEFRYDLRRKDNPGEPDPWVIVENSSSPTIYSSAVAGGLKAGDYDVLITSLVSEAEFDFPTGCDDVDRFSFTIEGPTEQMSTASTGNDRNICGTTATLSGGTSNDDPLKSGETVKWTKVTESGTITNSTSTTASVSGLAYGDNTFRYTITSSFGCTNSDEVTITRDRPPSTPNAGSDQNVCESTVSLSASALGAGETGLWTVVKGNGSFSDNTIRNPTVSALNEGENTFRWTVTKNNSCASISNDVTINYIIVTTSNAGVDQNICVNSTTLNANATKSEETGTWTMVRGGGSVASVNSRTSTVSNLSDGRNTFRWTITDNTGTCASNSSTVDIYVTDLEINEVTAKRTNPTCFGYSDGSITVIGIGGDHSVPLDYKFTLGGNANEVLFANEGDEVTFQNLEEGIYNVTIEDDAGCMRTVDNILLTDPLEIEIDYTQVNISCFGLSDGVIDISTVNGVPPFSYYWTRNGVYFAESEDLLQVPEGTYNVVITDDNGCSQTEEVILTEPFPLQSDVLISNYDGYSISCKGANDGFIEVEPTGGSSPYTYLWSNGETTPNITDLTAGDYSVEITDFNGCSITENYSLTEPDQLNFLEPQITDVECFGDASGQVILYTSGGASGNTYSLDGLNFQSSNIFSGLIAGDYTFQVKDTNNCMDEIDVTITEPEELRAVITNAYNARCGDPVGYAKVAVKGGVDPYNISWENSNGEVVGTGIDIKDILAGIYRVIVTDANNCTDSEIINISSTDGAKLSVESVSPTSCFNTADGQATISLIGIGPFDVEWANGETGTTAVNLVAGLNTVSITDLNGCLVVEQVEIPSPDPIVISVTENSIPSCNGSSDGVIAVDITGGTGNYDILWSNGDTTSSLEGIASGNYSITVTDENACTITKDILLEEKEALALEISETTTPSCVGSSDGSLTINAIGGNGNYTYEWGNGEDENTLSNITAGSYSVLISDGKGCTYQQTIELEEPEPFEILVDNVWEICTGSSYFTDYNIPGAVNYQWSSDSGFESNERVVELSEAGIYQLTVENENGCFATEEFELIVSDDLLSADITLATEVNIGDTVIVVDLSWPIPDSVNWNIPESATVVKENVDYISLIFQESGEFEIGIEVKQAECSDYYSQTIKILSDSEAADSNQRIFGVEDDLIKKFSVYPNPIVNNFNIDIELSQKHDLSVNIIDLKGNRIIFNESFKDKIEYLIPMKDKLNSGVYIVRIDVGGESSYKRIIVR